jgi:hypothetical protein
MFPIFKVREAGTFEIYPRVSLYGERRWKCPPSEENTELLLAYSSFSAENAERIWKTEFSQFCKIRKNPLDSTQTQWYYLTCTQRITAEAHQMRKHRIRSDVPEQLKSGKEHKVTHLACQLGDNSIPQHLSLLERFIIKI